MDNVVNVDECERVVIIEACDPVALVDAMHVPLVGVIEPQPDPVYGHTFKMPDLKEISHG